MSSSQFGDGLDRPDNLEDSTRSAELAIERLGRLGGDEFALFSPDTSHANARVMVDRFALQPPT